MNPPKGVKRILEVKPVVHACVERSACACAIAIAIAVIQTNESKDLVRLCTTSESECDAGYVLVAQDADEVNALRLSIGYSGITDSVLHQDAWLLHSVAAFLGFRPFFTLHPFTRNAAVMLDGLPDFYAFCCSSSRCIYALLRSRLAFLPRFLTKWTILPKVGY